MLLLCSRCGNVVILNVFRQVSILCHFRLFLSCVLGVFNSPVATLAHGLLGHTPESSFTIYIRKHEFACFIYLCHHRQSHFTKLLTRDLFNVGLVTVHIFSLPFHHFESPSHP